MELKIEIPNSLYANLAKIQRGSIASKRILDCVREGVPIDERPKGRWIKHENPNLGICLQEAYECSNCGKVIGCKNFIYRSYCSYCGAEMEI